MVFSLLPVRCHCIPADFVKAPVLFFSCGGPFSHHAHDASNPPAAGHDDAAGAAAALEVVGPGVVAHEGLADALALRVTAPALDAAHAQVIQHGVKSHPFTFQLIVWVVWIKCLVGFLCHWPGSIRLVTKLLSQLHSV